MRYKRGCLAAFIAATLLMLAGCMQKNDDAVPTLVVYLGATEELSAVSEAIDAYIMEKIGVHVRLEKAKEYTSNLNTALKNGEQIDIVYCSSLNTVTHMTDDGWLLPLDDLLEGYSGILDTLDPESYEFSRQDGKLYALPTNRDRHEIIGFEYDMEIAEQYGLDLSGVETLEDLGMVFARLQECAPDIAPTVVVPSALRLPQVDTLGDSYGVLTGESGTTIVNLYETEAFTQLVTLLYQWQNKGYMLDYQLDAGSVAFYLRSGQVFGCMTFGNVGFEAQETKLCGRKIGFLPLSEPYCPSSKQSPAWYGIPATSPDPALAMELLSLLYTDPVLANMILYGIEGVHYVRDPENPHILHYPNGTASGYTGPRDWAYCNRNIADVWEGYDPDIWKKTEETNRTAARSPAWGIQFDNTPVAEEIHLCDAVCDTYLPTLYAGLANPDKTLPEFRHALRNAGIDAVIAEKQRQLNRFLEGGE